jgi:NitT/TauT family transport system ATP-binding protein
MKEDRLKITNCTSGYVHGKSREIVFSDLDLSFTPGETTAVLGPSGCGKSTLLLTAAALLNPFEGTVSLDERPLQKGDKRVGVILQQYGLFPWMTVWDNIVLGLRIRGGYSSREAKEASDTAAAAVVADLGLEGLEGRFPSALSGGQQQRVAIGRTLVSDPEVLLMDEPFSALDSITREKQQELLSELLEKRKIVAVVVTHSVEEAVFLGSRILLMGRNKFSIIESEFSNPGAGTEDYRSSDEYSKLCSGVRKELRRVDG